MLTYAYPEGNKILIDTLNLQPHPEAGFFCETARTEETVPSPFAGDATRNMATQIYYLLTPDSPQGKMHMNKSITYHLLHQGRAKYTLIRPASAPSSSPEIKHVIMGADSSRGEVRHLVVEGGWWKASEIPGEDLDDEEADKDKVGCLISEASLSLLFSRVLVYAKRARHYPNHALPLEPQVVVPGFDFADHKFLDRTGLVELFGGDESHPAVEQLLPYTQER